MLNRFEYAGKNRFSNYFIPPFGWVFGDADIGFQVISGTSLTDRIGKAIDNY